MRIDISGVNTINKGAELMLCAIVQEIERKFDKATVFVPNGIDLDSIRYINTKIEILHKPFAELRRGLSRVARQFRRLGLHVNFLYDYYPMDNIDYFLDASGFAFSDQWNPDKFELGKWNLILDRYRCQGTKTIFLPQAFGPVKQPITKQLVKDLLEKADIVIPREKRSFEYLNEIGIHNNNVRVYSDFTNMVDGVIPNGYEYLKNAVCIIPNNQMVNKGTFTEHSFIDFLVQLITFIRGCGYRVYLLNHEGYIDNELALNCKKILGGNLDVVFGLNPLEIKGLISTSYMCITSRFHGLASALNSNIPTLSTSWSHKYEELYKDYGLSNFVLDTSNIATCKNRISEMLDKQTNIKIRQQLQVVHPVLVNKTKEMWNWIWEK